MKTMTMTMDQHYLRHCSCKIQSRATLYGRPENPKSILVSSRLYTIRFFPALYTSESYILRFFHSAVHKRELRPTFRCILTAFPSPFDESHTIRCEDALLGGGLSERATDDTRQT